MSGEKGAVKTAVLEIVDNQIQMNDPPETKRTYHRLRRKGLSDQEARALIGAVLTSEMTEMMQRERPFDEKRFAKALRRLPKLPWE